MKSACTASSITTPAVRALSADAGSVRTWGIAVASIMADLLAELLHVLERDGLDQEGIESRGQHAFALLGHAVRRVGHDGQVAQSELVADAAADLLAGELGHAQV